MKLCMPTVLAASLLVFMRAFADFGTPLLIGENYRTFPVEIYNQYLGENGTDHNFAAAISVIAIALTALVFFAQKWATSKFRFSMNALHPIQKKAAKGVRGFFMYFYCYALVAIAFLPQLYIVYLSFRNCDQAVFLPGYSFANYELAARKLLGRSIRNTLVLGFGSLAIIIVFSVLIAYLVVRRSNIWNHMIDTLSMLPYIMPGSVIGIALVLAFGKQPIVLTGTMLIMIISLVIRRMPYTIRSANATLMQIPISIEEASISLGTSKLKTFVSITVPMMANGILSGAILSWVSIVTELSSAIILYNNRTITLTMSAYVAISRGNYGLACAFSAVLTVLTTISLLGYLMLSKTEDIKL
jgi:iron(III) transport system permease protein